MERSCGPMNKNRIEGIADQGERARNRKALVIKRKRRRSGLGTSRLVPEKAAVPSRSEKSGRSVLGSV